MLVDEVTAEVEVRDFALTTGALASCFTELLSPLEKKNNNFCLFFYINFFFYVPVSQNVTNIFLYLSKKIKGKYHI